MEQVARRNSKQRRLILEALMENPVHPSAETIYNMLKPEHPELSLGTVYCNLNLLADMGIIQRVQMSIPQEHYDGNTSCHYHMLCDTCGEIVDIFPGDRCGTLKCGIETDEGHFINEQCVLFHGTCANCRSKSDSNE